MNTTQTLDKLIVTRDGQLDDDYYDRLFTLKRKAALKQLAQGSMSAAVLVSKNIVSLLKELPQHINEV